MDRRRWVCLILLSVAVAGLLTIFIRTISQPPNIETVTLKAIEWSFQRPSDPDIGVTINNTLESLYAGDAISAKLSVLVWKYESNFHADRSDCLTIIIKMNLATSNPDAWIRSVHVAFRNYQASILDISETSLDFENLTLSDSAEEYKKAFVRLNGVNHPNEVHFTVAALWNVLTPESQSHQMEILYEITYYNGTAYKKLVQPFQLNLAGATS